MPGLLLPGLAAARGSAAAGSAGMVELVRVSGAAWQRGSVEARRGGAGCRGPRMPQIPR